MTNGTPRYEYRVRWRREGHQGATSIYQTRQAAERKARGILALDQVKDDTRMEDMDSLAGPPTIERRQVGEWESYGFVCEATDEDREGMLAYFGKDDPGVYGAF